MWASRPNDKRLDFSHLTGAASISSLCHTGRFSNLRHNTDRLELATAEVICARARRRGAHGGGDRSYGGGDRSYGADDWRIAKIATRLIHPASD